MPRPPKTFGLSLVSNIFVVVNVVFISKAVEKSIDAWRNQRLLMEGDNSRAADSHALVIPFALHLRQETPSLNI